MWKWLTRVNKNLVIAIPVAMAAGFGYGIAAEAAFLKHLIVPFTFLMVYPMMVTLNVRKVFEGGDARAQIVTQLLNFAVIPFGAFGLGLVFFKDDPFMALGLLLAGLLPTSGMTISWTGFAKGNVAAAVKMTVIGLTLGSLATPFYVDVLMGASLDVHMAAVFKQIAIIVFIPMLAGYLTRRGLVTAYGQNLFQSRWAPRFPAMSTIGVLGIVFIAIALKADAIAAAPRMLLAILAPLALLYLANYALSTVVGRLLLPRGDAIALVYGSVMRNLSIALAIAINAFGPQGANAALVIAAAYILQVQSAAWYVRLTEKIYGPAAEDGLEAAADAARETRPVTVPDPGVPPIRRILYATDLSETARHAVRYACSIGHRFDAAVTMLHVLPDPFEAVSAGAGIDVGRQLDVPHREAASRRETAAAEAAMHQRIRETSRLLDREIPDCPLKSAEVVVKTGDPVERIVEVAEQGDVDLVIMGTHGYGQLDGMFVGSVAKGVIHRCQKPVLVVRIPKDPRMSAAA